MRMDAPFGLLALKWLDELREIEMIVGEGNDALIGTELLTGTTLKIDYVGKVVTILRA